MGPIGVLAAAILTLNAALFLFAWWDGSLVAFALVALFGPVANGILCLFALVGIRYVRSMASDETATAYAVCAVLLPFIAAVVDYFGVMVIGPH